MYRPLLLGCALAMLTPLAAAAQDYTPNLKPSIFEEIDPAAPGAQTLAVTGDALTGVSLPFPVVYYGAVFNQINISTFGYVTFSSRVGMDELPGGLSDPAVAENQYPLPNADAPNGVVAAWWDDLRCPEGSIKTRDAMIEGSRTFTIEWNGCYRYIEPLRPTDPEDTSATVQMQLRFTENSPIVRAFYGSMGTATGHDATVGLENAPTWVQGPGGAWTLQANGGNLGVTPALAAPCSAEGCDGDAWPTHTMIQYGRPSLPDLMRGVNETSGILGLGVVGLHRDGAATVVQVENNIENNGLRNAAGVTWDYYVSLDDTFDDTDTPIDCGNNEAVDIAATAIHTAVDTCELVLDPGFYHLCTVVDPPSPDQANGAVREANEANNAYCSPAFVVGADLAGYLTVPAAGEAGEGMEVLLHVENRGADVASGFRVQVWLRDCNAINADQDVLAWETTLTLNGGQSYHQTEQVPLRPDASGSSVCGVLVIDPDDVIDEMDEGNNSYTTCRNNPGAPKACTAVTRPDLRVNAVNAEFANGCYFGDPIYLSTQICNDGPITARNFGVAFFEDVNSVATLNDTMIVAIPQACSTDADCVDLGGGAPSCVTGTCHAPCVTDADCGDLGMECMDSFDIPGKSCQLVVPGGKCIDLDITAELPEFDTRANAPFEDGPMYFSVIADWTDAVIEISEGNENKRSTQGRQQCWTRKPDFEPVDLRTVSEMASGEVIPVYRRVRNIGTVGGTFGYRYVLSSNDTITENDLTLTIEGVGPVGEATIGPRSDAIGNDLVRLPAGIVPGTYYLGILLDPLDEVLELIEDNNTALSEPFTVVDASLQVATNSLRTATVGAAYAVQLLASGGAGGYHWDLVGGALPPGLDLRDDGLLHGTPQEVGTSLFEVRVTSGGYAASRLLALDVVAARGPLAITLVELPPAFQNVEYRVTLGAAGGLPPYRWACPDMPDWLAIQNNLLYGTCPVVADPVAFTCTVTDALGTQASRTYSLGVYPAHGIRIRSPEIGGADVGMPIKACVAAEGGSGRYDWSYDPASAPAGVGFEEQDNAGCFTGVPTECGTFLVGVTVSDEESGLTDSRRLSLNVYCHTLRLTTRSLPVAERGVEYPEVKLTTSSAGEAVFEIAAGALPQGLALAADGTISGVVAVDAPAGTHQLAVRFYDETGASGTGAVAIEVLAEAGPSVTINKTKTLTGCSASGESSATGLWPFAALLAFLGLRRRTSVRAATAAALGAVLLLPAVASAQITPGYASYQRPVRYEPLPETANTLEVVKNLAQPIDLEDWTVPYFNQRFSRVWAHENGLLIFSDTEPTETATIPYKIPYVSSTSPRNFATAWWDDLDMLSEGASLRWMVRGEAPNRELVVEWKWLTIPTNDEDDGAEQQISVFEDGTITMRWGNIIDSGKAANTFQASIGLVDRNASPRSVPFHECSTYTNSATAACNGGDWVDDLQDTEAVFTTVPNLQVRSTATILETMAGLEQTFAATVYNYGATPAEAPVRFYASTDSFLGEDDLLVGTSEPVLVNPFAERTVEIEAALPIDLVEGWYYLFAVIDPDDVVAEFVETDNRGGNFQFQVMERLPDLGVVRVGAPSFGVPGSRITVDISVANNGNLDVVDFPFAVVLSDNAVITATDQVLYQGHLDVGWMQTVETSVDVTIPGGTLPGLYHLGVVLDPAATVRELDKLDNSLASERPFVVAVDGLAVVTVLPTSIEIGAELCIPLLAEGGDGAYTWSVIDGDLPPGLVLIPGDAGSAAAICGRPTALGIYDFVLSVVSGNRSASTQATIEVVPTTLTLGISARDLPMARFQIPYETGLLAFGGTVPYTWAITSGKLPEGLSFDDDGMIFGIPQETGTFSFQVQVTDAADRTATEAVTLFVAAPPRVTCATTTLGTLALGQPFNGVLRAAGGRGAYEWTTRSLRRIGDAGGLPLDEEAPPPGLILGVTGEISGVPEQVGRYIWNVEVKALESGDSDTCPVTLEVEGGQGLTVVTTALPPAAPGEEYRVQLQAIGGSGTLRWTLADGAALPEGLALAPSGLLSGMATMESLQGEPRRTFGFLVEVRDGRNLKGVGSLAVTVAPDAVGTVKVVERTVDEGCSAAGGGFSLAALGLVLAALRRRR